MAFCEQCGAKLNEGAKFCGKCGVPITVEDVIEQNEESSPKCAKCGAQLDEDEQFCSMCGAAAFAMQSDTSQLNNSGNSDSKIVEPAEAISLDPNNAIDKKIIELTEAIRLDPINSNTYIEPHESYTNAYVERGRWYTDKGEYKLAFKDINEAIRVNPTNPDVYFYRGDIYFNNGEYDLAINDYNEAIREAIRLDPNYIREVGSYRKIIELTEAIRLDPNNAELYYQRGTNWFNGVYYYHFGEDDLRLKDFNEAIRLGTNHAEAYFYRGKFYNNSKPDLAIKDYTEAIRLGTDHDRLSEHTMYSLRGDAYYEIGKYDLAINDYTIVKNFWSRGKLYLKKGEFNKAVEDFSKCIPFGSGYKNNPYQVKTVAAAYHYRGLAYHLLGNKHKATQDFNKAISLDPNLNDVEEELRGIPGN